MSSKSVQPYKSGDPSEIARELDRTLGNVLRHQELSDFEHDVVRRFLVLTDVRRVAKDLGASQADVKRVLEKPQVQEVMRGLVENVLSFGPLSIARQLQRLDDIINVNVTHLAQYDREDNVMRLNPDMTDEEAYAIKRWSINIAGSLNVEMYDKFEAMKMQMEWVKLLLGISDQKGVVVNINNQTQQANRTELEVRELEAELHNLENPDDLKVVDDEDLR